MSLTLPSTFRTPKDDSTVPQQLADVPPVTRPETILETTNRVCDTFQQPSYSSPEQLLGAIQAAEDILFAHGVLVDLALADLDTCKAEQWAQRKRVMDLRQQLIAMEREG